MTISESSHENLMHQLVHVFRYKVGQQVILFDGSGFDYIAEIADIDKKQIIFSIKDKKEGLAQENLLNKKIAVCFSLIKKDNVEIILQKCTELGVTEFYPILSERSEKKGFNEERAEKILIEATEQSGWSKKPTLYEVSDLESVIEKTKNMKQIVFHVSETPTLILPLKGEGKEMGNQDVVLFIGPEGGWTESEIEIFKHHNVSIQSLGAQTLRAETAAIAAVAKFT